LGRLETVDPESPVQATSATRSAAVPILASAERESAVIDLLPNWRMVSGEPLGRLEERF
jgi:hypothetical protein